MISRGHQVRSPNGTPNKGKVMENRVNRFVLMFLLLLLTSSRTVYPHCDNGFEFSCDDECMINSLKKITSVQIPDSVDEKILQQAKLIVVAHEATAYYSIDTSDVIFQHFIILDQLDSLYLFMLCRSNINLLELVIYDPHTGYFNTEYEMGITGLNYLILNHGSVPEYKSPLFMVRLYFIIHYNYGADKMYLDDVKLMQPDSMWFMPEDISKLVKKMSLLDRQTVTDSLLNDSQYQTGIFAYGIIPHLYKVTGEFFGHLIHSIDIEEIEKY
jgi:hypothetical protein